MVRNDVGDFDLALDAFGRVLMRLKKDLFAGRHHSARRAKYVFELYVVALFAKASCYYYGERDYRSFCTFRLCLDILQTYNRRKVFGIVSIGDVRRKIDSIAFLREGYKQAARMIRLGNFNSAVRLMDAAIENIGIGYLDHEILISAAKAHLAVGNFRRGCSLTYAAYHDSPLCLDVQFVLALVLFDKQSDASLRQFHDLYERFAQNNTDVSCKISLPRRGRMKEVLDDLKESILESKGESGHLVVDKRTTRFSQQGKLKIRKCIQFVDSGRSGPLSRR